MPAVKQKVKDWGGLLTGIAALAGVGLTYIQAISSEDVATRQAAKQEAQLEKAYELLVTAVNRLGDQASQRDKLIGDMREAIGEIRGALAQINRRTERALNESEALERVAPKPAKRRGHRRPASAASSPTAAGDMAADEVAPMEHVQEQVQMQMELPEIASDVVDKKVVKLKEARAE